MRMHNEIKAIDTTREQLTRIHAYADTLGLLCEMGTHHDQLSPESLEVIFKDIATVTYQAELQMQRIVHALQTIN